MSEELMDSLLALMDGGGEGVDLGSLHDELSRRVSKELDGGSYSGVSDLFQVVREKVNEMELEVLAKALKG